MRQFFLGLMVFGVAAAKLHAAEFDEKKVERLAEKALKDFEAPGVAIAIVKDDKVLFARGFGVRHIGKDSPVTENTLFAIASCSKAFTAGAVAVMIDEGKMKWDDRINKHLPWFHMSDPFADREVTLRDALCHRTGLSRHDILWVRSPYDRENLLRRVASIPPTTSFRSNWEYNNILFVAAGEATGKADQSSWEAIVQKKIFDPLGMKTANFSTKTAEKLEHARPHRRNEDRTIEEFPWDNLDHVGPAGAINVSVKEMASWIRMHLSGGKLDGKTIISSANVKEMHTSQMIVRNEGYFSIFFPPDVTDHLSYGLGWFVADYRGQRCISHGGTLEGFRAQTVLVPKQKLGLVVLTNLGGCRLPEALSKNLLDMLLELPERDWNTHYMKHDKDGFDKNLADLDKHQKERVPDTKPSLKVADYAGRYETLDYGDAVVALEKDALYLTWNGYKAKLDHFHFDTFSYAPPYRYGDDRVTFHLNGAGKSTSLTMLGKDFKKR